jgi:hypothetical protein
MAQLSYATAGGWLKVPGTMILRAAIFIAARISLAAASGSTAIPVSAELIFQPMAARIEKTCQAAVVFSGYHGDKM